MKQTSSELPQVSERNMHQGEPNQLYLKLHRGEWTYSTREIDHLGWWIQHRKACEERYQIHSVLSSLEGIYSNTGEPTGEWSCMLPVCQGPIGRIIIRTDTDNTDLLLLTVHSFSRGQLTGHLYVWWTYWKWAIYSRISHCKRDWPISLWMSPCCATPFGVWYHMFSKQKRQEAYSKLVTHIDMPSNHSMSIT